MSLHLVYFLCQELFGTFVLSLQKMSENKSLHNPETASDPVATEAGTRGQSPVEDSKVGNPDIVDWDGSEDAANPHNWTASKRWTHIIVVSLLALVTYVNTRPAPVVVIAVVQSQCLFYTPAC